MAKHNYHGRLLFLLIVIFLLGGGVLSRLFFLQVLQYDQWSAAAKGQQQFYQTLFPKRGEIMMQDLSVARREGKEEYYPLAANKEFQQVYLIPKDILEEEKENLAKQLSELLELDEAIILQRMNKPNDPYEPLKNKVDGELTEKIRMLNAKGIGFAPEVWRYYPNGSLASHLIGFVGGEDRSGQYGLESYYDSELSGQAGFLAGGKDTSGHLIPTLSQKFESSEDGTQLILTIDQNIQFAAEKELNFLIDKLQAESGTIIIMEPTTGSIWAMANWPSFDPNEYNKVEDINVFLNPAIQKVYEPGSIFKPLTIAGGLEYGKITPLTTYQDMGEIHFGGSVIKNFDGKVRGEQTMTQVLEKSLNTGAVFAQRALGEELFRTFVERLKLNEPTGIDVGGEVGGNVANLYSGREINLATISFGQGVTVTPLGMVTALASAANQGNMMKPFLVQKIIKADGTVIKTKPQVRGRVMSSETAEDLTKMMVSVTDIGYDKLGGVEGYAVASKTGTAQMVDPATGGYSEENTIHSFAGFAPAFNPQFFILIKIDKPQGVLFASNSIAPSFGKLAKYMFNYLEIPPQ